MRYNTKKEDLPSLEHIFTNAIEYTNKEDYGRSNSSTFIVAVENESFQERVLVNFLILATGFYSKSEIAYWIENSFMPDILN